MPERREGVVMFDDVVFSLPEEGSLRVIYPNAHSLAPDDVSLHPLSITYRSSGADSGMSLHYAVPSHIARDLTDLNVSTYVVNRLTTSSDYRFWLFGKEEPKHFDLLGPVLQVRQSSKTVRTVLPKPAERTYAETQLTKDLQRKGSAAFRRLRTAVVADSYGKSFVEDLLRQLEEPLVGVGRSLVKAGVPVRKELFVAPRRQRRIQTITSL